MNTEDSINRIMGEVELFIQTHSPFPSAGGILTTTERLYHLAEEFESKPDLIESYSKVKVLAEQFPAEFKNFVNESDFLEKWSKMTTEEKSYLIYFDNISYLTLRKIFPANELNAPNWSEILSNTDVRLTNELVEKLGLPSEFARPPNNKLEQLTRKNFLISIGCNEKDVTTFEIYVKGLPSSYDSELFKLVCKNKTNDELDKLMTMKDVSLPWYEQHKQNFFAEQEEKFQKKERIKP